jgi:uncharacterized membrane protein
MPFWYALNLLLLIFEIVARWHEPEISSLIVAGSIWVAVILFTVVFLVPINHRMARLNPDSLSEAARREQKMGRTSSPVLAVSVALICFLLGTHR